MLTYHIVQWWYLIYVFNENVNLPEWLHSESQRIQHFLMSRHHYRKFPINFENTGYDHVFSIIFFLKTVLLARSAVEYVIQSQGKGDILKLKFISLRCNETISLHLVNIGSGRGLHYSLSSVDFRVGRLL